MHCKPFLFRWMAVLALSLAMMAAGANSAWSADLRTAKSTGQIGEQLNGYLGIVTAVPEDVRVLVRDINRKRKAVYQNIARKSGATLRDVERMAGKKAIAKTPPGQYIQSSSGQWVIKK